MVGLIAVVVVIIIVSIFSVQNAMPVAISFLTWHFNASLAIIALLFFLAGAVAGIAVLAWSRMRRAVRKKKSEADQRRTEGQGSPDLR